MAKLHDLKVKLHELSNHIPYLKDVQVSQEWLIDEDNKSSFPNSEFPGIYFFTDKNDEIIYVGKASNGLGARLGAYIGKNNNMKDQKMDEAKAIFTIKVERSLFFLSPAIEEFLIDSLNPRINKIGRKYLRFIQENQGIDC